MNKKSQEEIFQETWDNSEFNVFKYKKKGGKITTKNESFFLTPLLKKNKLYTWEKINREATLIVDGKSELSSKARGVIDHVHTHVLIMYQKQFNGE
jgi:hypothetical protein